MERINKGSIAPVCDAFLNFQICALRLMLFSNIFSSMAQRTAFSVVRLMRLHSLDFYKCASFEHGLWVNCKVFVCCFVFFFVGQLS
uniref:Uncharacterized protein n=1 Tax=Ixodes ricinus TaxID=34613 RepID=A0A6B0UFA0_IXORI